jgi:hypothetical protein
MTSQGYVKSKILAKLQGGFKNPNENEFDCAHSNYKECGGCTELSKFVEENTFMEFHRVTMMLSILAAINSRGRKLLDLKEYEADPNFNNIPA